MGEHDSRRNRKDVRELSNLLVEVLEEHIAHHRRVHALYEKAFEQVEGIALKSNPGKDWNANYWLCTVLLDKGIFGTPEEVRLALDAHGIESRPLWKPMHLQPVYAHNPHYVDGTSEALFEKGLCLLAGPCVTDGDVEKIVKVLLSCRH